jgi:hypothetical protein
MPPRSLCASSSVPLLSTLLLSTQQLSGVTSSSSIDVNRGMDDEDGDSDAGASEHVCSPGSAMRCGNMIIFLAHFLRIFSIFGPIR